MKQIPENYQDIKELLCKQLSLLAEKSKVENCKGQELVAFSHGLLQVRWQHWQ